MIYLEDAYSRCLQNNHYDTFVQATVTHIEPLTPTSKLLHICLDGHATFSAGQYMCFYHTLPSKDLREQPSIFPGTYSIASTPSLLPIVHIAVQNSHNPRNLRHFFINECKVGDRLWANPRGFGSVCVTASSLACPLVWNGGNGGICLIAGGFGIPALISVVSLLSEELNNKSIIQPNISLIHSVRDENDIPFYEQLKSMELKNERLKVVHTVTGQNHKTWTGRKGRINEKLLAETIPGMKMFCVFGSEDFVKSIVTMLLDLGVWPANIRTDYSTRVDHARLLRITESDEKCGQLSVHPPQLNAGKVKTELSWCSQTLNSEHDEGQQVENGKSKRKTSTRFETKTERTKTSKTTSHANAVSRYLKMSGMADVLNKIAIEVEKNKPEKPISFTVNLLNNMLRSLSNDIEVNNTQAADPQFWIDYWQTDSVLWHNPEVSPWLLKYERDFLPEDKQRIFVPLCGKSVDMLYLARKGHDVIGAECSGIACADFFSENHVPGYTRTRINEKVVCHSSSRVSNIKLFECDIFQLSSDIIGGPVDRILDRAAIVALHPSSVKQKYLPLLSGLLSDSPGSSMLLASVSCLAEPVAPPHCYTNEKMSELLQCVFGRVEHLMDYSYKLDAGTVVEPIFLCSEKRHYVLNEFHFRKEKTDCVP